MFWNKKNVAEVDGQPVLLSRRCSVEKYTGLIKREFLAWKKNDEWRGLIGYEEYKEDQELRDRLNLEIEQKLNLILDHLKLNYVPEKETKEPAKLVVIDSICISPGYGITISNGGEATGVYTSSSPSKKKRGRPRKAK